MSIVVEVSRHTHYRAAACRQFRAVLPCFVIYISLVFGMLLYSVHYVWLTIQTIFTMSAQQQWLREYTDSDYARLSGQLTDSVSNRLYLLMCIMLGLTPIITLLNAFVEVWKLGLFCAHIAGKLKYEFKKVHCTNHVFWNVASSIGRHR